MNKREQSAEFKSIKVGILKRSSYNTNSSFLLIKDFFLIRSSTVKFIDTLLGLFKTSFVEDASRPVLDFSFIPFILLASSPHHLVVSDTVLRMSISVQLLSSVFHVNPTLISVIH